VRKDLKKDDDSKTVTYYIMSTYEESADKMRWQVEM